MVAEHTGILSDSEEQVFLRVAMVSFAEPQGYSQVCYDAKGMLGNRDIDCVEVSYCNGIVEVSRCMRHNSASACLKLKLMA